MTTDLWMLVLSAVLCLVLPLPYLVARAVTPGGVAWGLGNREEDFRFGFNAAQTTLGALIQLAGVSPVQR